MKCQVYLEQLRFVITWFTSRRLIIMINYFLPSQMLILKMKCWMAARLFVLYVMGGTLLCVDKADVFSTWFTISLFHFWIITIFFWAGFNTGVDLAFCQDKGTTQYNDTLIILVAITSINSTKLSHLAIQQGMLKKSSRLWVCQKVVSETQKWTTIYLLNLQHNRVLRLQ